MSATPPSHPFLVAAADPGLYTHLQQLASGDALLTLAVVTVIAIISKLAGGFLGALSLGKRGATIVGFGMVPRGEVGVVIASLGLAAGVFSDRTYAIIVAMSLLTAMVTPPVLAAFNRSSNTTGCAPPPRLSRFWWRP